MLTLDYQPNLSNDLGGVCDTVDSDKCRAYFGTDDVGTLIYSQLDKTSDVKLFDAFRAVFKAIFASDVADDTQVGLMMNHNKMTAPATLPSVSAATAPMCCGVLNCSSPDCWNPVAMVTVPRTNCSRS